MLFVRKLMASLLVFMILYALRVIQGLSTRGKHFVVGIPENRILAEYPIIRLYMTSLSKMFTNVTISTPYLLYWNERAKVRHVTLNPGEVAVEEYSIEIQTEGTVLDDKGIIVSATEEITVQIGSFNDFSSDAFVAFPTNSLSTDYIVLTYLYTDSIYLGTKQGPSQFLIISPENNVVLSIKFKNSDVADSIDTDNLYNEVDLATKTLNITIEECQTLQIQSDLDLTGTRITSSRPVAVVVGAVWSSVMVEEMGDHLVEQLPPTNTWGAEYLAVPVANRTSGDIFRVIAKLDDTKVLVYRPGIGDTEYIDLHSGEHRDFHVPSGQVKRIIGDKPILLIQLCASFRADEGTTGDPFMSLLPSLEQLSNSYSFASLRSLFDGFHNFATLITNASDASNVLLNGLPISSYDVYLEWDEIIDTQYKTLTLSLPETATFYNLTVIPNDATIGGVLYGYQNQESYGLVIGQELDTIEYRCADRPASSLTFFGSSCDGSFYGVENSYSAKPQIPSSSSAEIGSDTTSLKYMNEYSITTLNEDSTTTLNEDIKTTLNEDIITTLNEDSITTLNEDVITTLNEDSMIKEVKLYHVSTKRHSEMNTAGEMTTSSPYNDISSTQPPEMNTDITIHTADPSVYHFEASTQRHIQTSSSLIEPPTGVDTSSVVPHMDTSAATGRNTIVVPDTEPSTDSPDQAYFRKLFSYRTSTKVSDVKVPTSARQDRTSSTELFTGWKLTSAFSRILKDMPTEQDTTGLPITTLNLESTKYVSTGNTETTSSLSSRKSATTARQSSGVSHFSLRGEIEVSTEVSYNETIDTYHSTSVNVGTEFSNENTHFSTYLANLTTVPNSLTTEVDNISNISDTAGRSSRRKHGADSLSRTLKLAVIFIGVIVGVPCLCYLGMCLKTCCSKTTRRRRLTKGRVSICSNSSLVSTTMSNQELKLFRYGDFRGLVTYDCRNEYSDQCSYG